MVILTGFGVQSNRLFLPNGHPFGIKIKFYFNCLTKEWDNLNSLNLIVTPLVTLLNLLEYIIGKSVSTLLSQLQIAVSIYKVYKTIMV